MATPWTFGRMYMLISVVQYLFYCCTCTCSRMVYPSIPRRDVGVRRIEAAFEQRVGSWWFVANSSAHSGIDVDLFISQAPLTTV